VSTPVRDAATVVLLRDGPTGLETWLLTRVRAMVFAAGMSVFPGGRVEASDAELPGVAVAGGEVARRFQCEESLGRALVGAAVRETFEETGLLLTEPPTIAMDARADVEARRLSFLDLLTTRGLTVDGAALRPWARWITPEGEIRRYDTRFFVAALPDGAAAVNVTTESSAAGWLNVRTAIADERRGVRALLPPTLSVLRAVAEHETVAAVVAAADRQDLTAVEPRLLEADGETWALLPDGTRLPLRRAAP
jgi:8-oxo-dGTP pyrophosphatase MutT (NUDIX family)